MIVLDNGQYEVHGDFGPTGYILGQVSISIEGAPTPAPGTYDPLNGPFYGYDLAVTANNGHAESCYFSQTQSLCGRTLHNAPTFDVSDFDGDGIGHLFVTTSVWTTNMTLGPVHASIQLPDGFTITGASAPVPAVPEPSTWAILLIGFVLIAIRRRKWRSSSSLCSSSPSRRT